MSVYVKYYVCISLFMLNFFMFVVLWVFDKVAFGYEKVHHHYYYYYYAS